MPKTWVNSFFMPSGLLRGEYLYRVRRHDGSVVEGFALRQYMSPTWHSTLQRKSKKLKREEITAVWGLMEVSVLEKGEEKTLIALPDDQVVLVKNERVHYTRPETVEHA